MAIIETVFAMMMIVNGSMDGFMKQMVYLIVLKLREKVSVIYRIADQMLFVMNVAK